MACSEISGPKRVPALGDVPTIVEAGFPSLVVEDWTGFAVKRGTPKAVVAQLNAAINKALAKPTVREAFARLGAEPAGGSPDQYGSLVNQQIAHWRQIVSDAKIKVSP